MYHERRGPAERQTAFNEMPHRGQGTLHHGVKSAHYEGPEWAPFERAVEVGAQLGHLSVGAVADVAVLRVEKGDFGFLDQAGARMKGTERLRCELTLRDGKVVWDLNGLAAEDWDKLRPRC